MWFFVSVYFLASNLSYLRWPIRLMRVYTHWPINGRPHWYLICLFYEVFFMCFLVVLQHIDYWFFIFCFNITIEIYFSQRLNVLTHHRIFDIFHKTEKRMPQQKAALQTFILHQLNGFSSSSSFCTLLLYILENIINTNKHKISTCTNIIIPVAIEPISLW